ncbi:hypothetical protein QBC38DRAFT_473171 [Podospora fimiseda]|uniref:Secreted protein n=1 Tax=Podospora fimiseda TaxID=252190 RepID=A0AAN7BT87_9PEZI|nr:hypothetical protein QBC38DRAFT_473171 [Podospora fimiseda]
MNRSGIFRFFIFLFFFPSRSQQAFLLGRSFTVSQPALVWRGLKSCETKKDITVTHTFSLPFGPVPLQISSSNHHYIHTFISDFKE